MPIYEYKCENGHVFDIMQKMSDDSLTDCVECGAEVKKVLHPVGISFKGSGFYSTDYSKKATKSETASKNGEGNGKTDPSEKKTESSTATGKADKKKD